MLEAARALAADGAARGRLFAAARRYYEQHLDHRRIARELKRGLRRLAAAGARDAAREPVAGGGRA